MTWPRWRCPIGYAKVANRDKAATCGCLGKAVGARGGIRTLKLRSSSGSQGHRVYRFRHPGPVERGRVCASTAGPPLLLIQSFSSSLLERQVVNFMWGVIWLFTSCSQCVARLAAVCFVSLNTGCSHQRGIYGPRRDGIRESQAPLRQRLNYLFEGHCQSLKCCPLLTKGLIRCRKCRYPVHQDLDNGISNFHPCESIAATRRWIDETEIRPLDVACVGAAPQSCGQEVAKRGVPEERYVHPRASPVIILSCPVDLGLVSLQGLEVVLDELPANDIHHHIPIDILLDRERSTLGRFDSTVGANVS